MPFARCKPMLKDKGRLLAVAAGIPEMLATLWAPLTGSRRVIAGPAEERASDVPEMAALAEAGALKPVIDRRYRFAQMAEAHAYVETGRKRGSVVVSVEPPR
jgi:NADPH:quinone reductase-like Zn-dependent oxidoreductase